MRKQRYLIFTPSSQAKFRLKTLAWLGVMLMAVFAAGCASPIGVTRGSTQDTYYALTANVLSAGEPSSWSKQVLHRSNLTERFDDDPEGALSELRKTFATRVTPDRIFALAELSFYQAERSELNSHYLAAAVYAYAFLFPSDFPVTLI